MKNLYETPNGYLDGADIKNMRLTKRLIDGRESRAVSRTIDFRANDVFFSKIVEIVKDVLVNKLPVTFVASKHQISRKTVWRYVRRLKPDAVSVKERQPDGTFTWRLQ